MYPEKEAPASSEVPSLNFLLSIWAGFWTPLLIVENTPGQQEKLIKTPEVVAYLWSLGLKNGGTLIFDADGELDVLFLDDDESQLVTEEIAAILSGMLRDQFRWADEEDFSSDEPEIID